MAPITTLTDPTQIAATLSAAGIQISSEQPHGVAEAYHAETFSKLFTLVNEVINSIDTSSANTGDILHKLQTSLVSLNTDMSDVRKKVAAVQAGTYNWTWLWVVFSIFGVLILVRFAYNMGTTSAERELILNLKATPPEHLHAAVEKLCYQGEERSSKVFNSQVSYDPRTGSRKMVIWETDVLNLSEITTEEFVYDVGEQTYNIEESASDSGNEADEDTEDTEKEEEEYPLQPCNLQNSQGYSKL